MDYRHGDRRSVQDRRESMPAIGVGERRSGDRRDDGDRRTRVPDISAATAAIDPTPRPLRLLRRMCARMDELESRLGLGYRVVR